MNRPRVERLAAYALPALAAALVVHAALRRIPYPLAGDQALFLYAAERLAQGDRLYVDFWDFKQPGIFWFYWLGGRLFGFTLEGVHRLEALWMIALAALAWWTARRAGVGPGAACLAPIASVVAFYCSADAWHLTQVESLVGLPLLGIVAAAQGAVATRAQRLRSGAVIGLCAGVVAVFKLVLAIVPAGLCLRYAAHVRRSQGLRGWSAAAEVMLAASAALALVLAAAALPFAAAETAAAAFHANFVLPWSVAGEAPRAPVSRLLDAARWLLRATWPFLPLAAAGATLAAMRRTAAAPPGGLTATLLVGWALLAAPAVLVQSHSWWEYHAAIVVPPIGLLAALGLRALERDGSGPRWLAATRAALVAVAAIGIVAHEHRLLRQRRDAVADESALFEAATRRALGRSMQGERVYVLGDPRLLLASQGVQAIPLNGWAWEFMTERQWRGAVEGLERAAPRAVYVAPFYLELVCRRSPGLVEWLRRGYEPREPDATGGVWLLRRAEPETGPPAAWGACAPLSAS